MLRIQGHVMIPIHHTVFRASRSYREVNLAERIVNNETNV
jgi:hypothetical protein